MQEAEEEEDRQSRNASSVRYDDPWRDRRALGDPFPSEPSRAEILQLPEDIAGVAPVVGKGDEAPQKTPYRGNGARSPTDTNPYTSPENDKTDDEVNIAFPGLGGFAPEDGIGNINNVLGLGSLGRAFDAPTDRSQSSSRGLGALPGLGSASAWAPGLPTAGTPSRDRPPLASFESLFPVDNGTYPSGFPPPGGFRPRLGQMLPQGMTDLEGLFDPAQDFSGLARPFGLPARETESPMRAGRNIFDDISGDEKPDAAFTTGTPPSIAAIAGRSGSFPPSLEAQMRTMVMPDRMKWQYKDHHGTTQGPFSGLEMHDWYKAGYFSPELLIKKLEDPDFEPLAQLIRKIGNSREPFLVPQVGIPHDPPPQRIFAGPSNAGGVQPPFPNSFPSFGTTLTAEQQNDLERRKQESQFLMARQKEHLAQQQLLIKMQQQIHPQPHGVFPPLNHQGSTPSLHSQPSFGNIAGAGFPPGQPMPGQMDGSFRPEAMPEDVAGFMERLVIGRTNQPPVQNDAVHAQQVEDMLNDRARLQQEQDAETQHMMQNDSSLAQAAAERHQQFHQLQSEEHVPSMPFTGQPCIPLGVKAQKPEKKVQEQSITQQVQAAVSAKSAQPIQWTRVDPTTMQPIAHPPQSSSPMPAPVAQRRQNVADTLTASSPSPAHTPSAETPSASVAPWAKEVAEVPKGPSLREIQEAEAKRAAQKEEIATAARRAALEKEVLAQQQAAAAAAQNPGLPSTSTWASGSNAPPANSSVWSKPAPVARNAPAISKKTLAQIQKEEEARKTKVTQTATAAVPSASGTGKRYADLASKNAPAQAASNGAWTTVGAGGKVKGAVPPSAPARTVSSSVAAPPRPKAASRSATIGNQAVPARGDAMEEFKKWAVKELRAHLDKSINGLCAIID
jgi:PERQ amino acid-rich with GYF domain-containing protein